MELEFECIAIEKDEEWPETAGGKQHSQNSRGPYVPDTLQGSLPDKRDKQRKERQRGGYDLLRHLQPRASYRGKGRDQPLGHWYCRWSLITCNRKRGRQAEQVKAVERPRIQKMTRTCRFAPGVRCSGPSVERTSDNPTSVLSAAGTRRRSLGSRQA